MCWVYCRRKFPEACGKHIMFKNMLSFAGKLLFPSQLPDSVRNTIWFTLLRWKCKLWFWLVQYGAVASIFVRGTSWGRAERVRLTFGRLDQRRARNIWILKSIASCAACDFFLQNMTQNYRFWICPDFEVIWHKNIISLFSKKEEGAVHPDAIDRAGLLITHQYNSKLLFSIKLWKNDRYNRRAIRYKGYKSSITQKLI